MKQFLLSVTNETASRFMTMFPEVHLIEVVGMDIPGTDNKFLINPGSPPQGTTMDIATDTTQLLESA